MSAQDADQSFIAEALPAFISEAGEQLEMLEQLLLQLEDEPDSQDLLGALFRCAHTVKGSAGIFGLDVQDLGAQQTGMTKDEFKAFLVAQGN